MLLDAMLNGDTFNRERLFQDILDECAQLEKRGLYHGDLRLWNVCLKDNRAFLIDFGNIQTSCSDSVARMFNPAFDYSVYDAFMALVYDVLTKKTYDYIKDYGIYNLATFYDLSRLESKYVSFFKSYLLLSAKERNFQKILDLYEKTVINESETEESILQEVDILYSFMKRGLCEKADSVELKATKICLHNQNDKLFAHGQKLSEQQDVISRQQDDIQELQNRLSEQRDLIAAQDRELSELRGLIMNTRHRTLFGVCEWLLGKIVRR